MKIKHFFFLLFIINSYSQEQLSSKITDLDKIVNAIRSKKSIEYFRLKNKNQFRKDSLYDQLKELSNKEEILNYINDSNGNLRVYSFRVLCEKYPELCYETILKNLHNYTSFRILNGCVIDSMYTTDLWIYLVSYEGWQCDYKLDSKQQHELNTIVIKDKTNKLYYRYDALKNIEITDGNYNFIKSLVINEKNGIALYQLAKYKKPDDLKIIASFYKRRDYLNCYLKAVEEFPDASFYPYLMKIVEQERMNHILYQESNWDVILFALAKYPIPQTTSLFQDLINEKSNEYNREICLGILQAIISNPNQIFDSIKSQIPASKDELFEIQNNIQMHNDY